MRESLVKIVQSEPSTGVRVAYFCQGGGGVREAITSDTFPEQLMHSRSYLPEIGAAFLD